MEQRNSRMRPFLHYTDLKRTRELVLFSKRKQKVCPLYYFSPIIFEKIIKFDNIFVRPWGEQVFLYAVDAIYRHFSEFQNWKFTCPLTYSSIFNYLSCRSTFTNATWHVFCVIHFIIDILTKDWKQPKYPLSRELVNYCTSRKWTSVKQWKQNKEALYILMNTLQGILNAKKDGGKHCMYCCVCVCIHIHVGI